MEVIILVSYCQSKLYGHTLDIVMVLFEGIIAPKTLACLNISTVVFRYAAFANVVSKILMLEDARL